MPTTNESDEVAAYASDGAETIKTSDLEEIAEHNLERCPKCKGSRDSFAGDACTCPPPPIYKDAPEETD